MKVTVIFLFFLTSLAGGCKKSKPVTNAPEINAELQSTILTDKLTFPWEILWGPDNFLWVTERGGRISRVDPSNGQIIPLITIPDVKSTGEGGLLGMVLHPDFNNTPQVFVVYNYEKNGSYKEKVVRYTYTSGSLTSPAVLLDNIGASNIHNGSRLLITEDKKLLITTGDASRPSDAQNPSSLNGKILRLNFDGSIPPDNPFQGSPAWTLGHRNAQGLVFANGKLYASEHGPDTDDELNIIEKGRNYGWPDVKGPCNEGSETSFCNANNVAEPIYSWSPTIAVCGIDYYNNDLIPQWKNSLIMTTLKDNTLYQLQLNPSGEKIEKVNTFFRGTFGRLRDVCIAPDGKIYIITSNGSGDRIVVISSKS